jgi:Arc/MetJ family transcription regulator
VHIGTTRRTNIESEDERLREAPAASGLRTKRAVVKAALEALVERAHRKSVAEMFGTLPGSESDLDVCSSTRPTSGPRWAEPGALAPQPPDRPRGRDEGDRDQQDQ